MKRITQLLLILVLVVPALVLTYQMGVSSTTSVTTTTKTTIETTTVTTTSIIPTTTTIVTTISTATDNTTTVTEATRLQTCITTTRGEQRIVNCNPPTTTITVTGTECRITGQPNGIFFRVLSDSTLKPVIGAIIRATHKPASVIVNNVECVYRQLPEYTQQIALNGPNWIAATTAATYSPSNIQTATTHSQHR